MPLAAAAAIAGAVALHDTSPLPAVALGSGLVLDALQALAIFDAFLLFFVPLVRAARGELPIELSFRGARWEADQSGTVKRLEDRLSLLSDDVETLAESIRQMRATGGPSPSPAP